MPVMVALTGCGRFTSCSCAAGGGGGGDWLMGVCSCCSWPVSVMLSDVVLSCCELVPSCTEAQSVLVAEDVSWVGKLSASGQRASSHGTN